MTEKITLELTLQELQLLDKYVEFDYDTKSLINKIQNAYPKPKMNFENEGKFHIVSYNGEVYYRLKYPTAILWFMKEHTTNGMMLCLVKDYDQGDKLLKVLEECWVNEVKENKND